MSKRESGHESDDAFDDKELIDAEFQSMVEGLSLDESAPTTYLDELDAIDHSNRFSPPTIPKRSLLDQIKDSLNAMVRWKNNRNNQHPDDGAAL
jgi:hypothetical protein